MSSQGGYPVFINTISLFRERHLPRPLLQEEVAAIVGCHPKTFGEYERGEREPAARTLVRIAAALGVPNPEFLLVDAERDRIVTEVEERRRSIGLPPRFHAAAREPPIAAIVVQGRLAGFALARRDRPPVVLARRLRPDRDAARRTRVIDHVRAVMSAENPKAIVLPDDRSHDALAAALRRDALPLDRRNLAAARRAIVCGNPRDLVVAAETALANRFPWLWHRVRPGSTARGLEVRDERLRYWRPALAALALALHALEPPTRL